MLGQGQHSYSDEDLGLGQGQDHLAVAGGYVVDALGTKGCAFTRYREVLTVSKQQPDSIFLDFLDVFGLLRSNETFTGPRKSAFK